MSATLKVAETRPKFVGRGIALVDPKVMEEMKLTTGDVIEVAGKKKSYVLLWSSQQEDYGKGLIRIDGHSRNNIGVGIDNKVEMTEGMTGADIAAVVNTAAMAGIKDQISAGIKGKLRISKVHFEKALQKVKRKVVRDALA